MSRVGNCIDHDPNENFWGIIKSEMYYLYKFNTYEELKAAIDKYIRFYNNELLKTQQNFVFSIVYLTGYSTTGSRFFLLFLL